MTLPHELISESLVLCPWFHGLPVDVIESLGHKSTLKSFEKSEFLYRLGEPQSWLYCVLSGRIRVTMNGANGQEFVLANLHEGAWLGEGSIVGIESAVLEAKTDIRCDILMLPAAAVLELADDYPLLYRNFFHEQMARSRLVFELMAGMLFYPLKARLAGRILWLAEHHGVPHPDGISLKVKLSQIDLARMTMGSRQRVNKTLREWVTSGVINRSGDYYVIQDVDALQAVLDVDRT